MLRPLSTVVLLLTLLPGVAPAEDAAPSPAPAAPAAEGAPATAAPPGFDRKALEEAFDGAMTCSALTAIKAHEAKEDEAWRWGNRSFAFGMLAVRFYTEATQQPLPREEIDKILTEYANALMAMKAEQRQPFEEGCGRKYADMDRLCEANKCPLAAPGSTAEAPAAPATPADGPEPAAAQP